MLADLAALTAPLVVSLGFIIGLVVLVRREMAPKRHAERKSKRSGDETRDAS